MTPAVPPSAERSRPRPWWLAALATATVLALVVRIPSIAEPLGIDQSLWASAARGLSRGLTIYRDVWDHKPPGIFLTYLWTFDLFGWTASSIAWLDLAASAATTWLLFLIVRRVTDVVAAVLAAALYAVLTVPAWMYGNGGFLERSVAETFVNVAVGVAALCAAAVVRGSGRRDLAATLLGVGVGVAVVFKPNAGIYLPALWIWIAACAGLRRDALLRVAALSVVGVIAPVLLTIAWLWHGGALRDSWIALVEFNRVYLAEGFTPGQAAVAFANAIGLRMKTDPLWAAGGIGSLVVAWDFARTRRVDPLAALAVAWGAGAAIAIFANGARLYNTYFIQALPPLAVLAAWVLAGWSRRSPAAKLAAVAAAVTTVAILGGRHYLAKVADTTSADLARLQGRLDRADYLDRFGGYATGRGYSARANDEMFAYVRDHTTRDELIYQFGINGSGVYFAADRLPAARFLRVTAFLPATLDDPGFARATVLDTLARARPAVIVFEQLHRTSQADVATTVDRLPQDGDVARLLADYRLDAQIEDFAIYRRR